MAGINVPQYEIFKIGTDKLKYSKWNLNIDKKEAFKYQESVSLFEGQQFRIMAKKIMKKAKWKCDFSKLFMQVVIDQKTDFARATNRKGVTVNGINYRRFVGTTGGLKNGMEITDEKYTDIIKTVTDSKDALLAAVEKKLESLTKTDVA